VQKTAVDEMFREWRELVLANEILVKTCDQVQSRESSKATADLLGAYRLEPEREKVTMERLDHLKKSDVLRRTERTLHRLGRLRHLG